MCSCHKKIRKPKTGTTKRRSHNMCDCCYAINCDPGTMGPIWWNKVHKRLRAGLCPSCGLPSKKIMDRQDLRRIEEEKIEFNKRPTTEVALKLHKNGVIKDPLDATNNKEIN